MYFNVSVAPRDRQMSYFGLVTKFEWLVSAGEALEGEGPVLEL